jgi:crossover junction endodeoxyribonuclease RuvC
MRILGIDPGLENTGYGLIEISRDRPVLIEAGLIRTKKGDPLASRLALISKEIEALIVQHRPDRIVVEDLYSYYKTPRPAILMGHVRGVVLGAAALHRVPVASVLPTRVKKSVVGRGHASKEQIARMVRMRLGIRNGQVPADVSDALAVALCHCEGSGRPGTLSDD